MTGLLSRVPALSIEEGGILGADLSKLLEHKIPVIPTVVITTDACRAYQEGTLPVDFFSSLFHAVNEISDGEGDLVLRGASPVSGAWCADRVRSKASKSAISTNIQHIFRSISTPRSRASRMSLPRIASDNEAAPAILIQPVCEQSFTLLSRHAVTGWPTTITNWQDNINNRLPSECEPHISLGERVEQVLHKPVLLSMSRTPLPEIIDVADAIMTDGARWEVLTSLHATGAISDVEYLRRIEPNMLGHMQGYGIDPESRFAEIRGIDASAGQVLGRVAFRGFDRSEFEDLPPVLFIEESTPEDIHDIDSSGAVVSSRGGKSSHAAVICRGMGMPCVVGCSTLVVHERNRLALLGNGLSVPERMPVLVNGTIGIVEFSDTGHLVPSFVTSREVGGRLNHLTTVLRNVTVMDRFKRLSVDDQTHVATLKYRLRELRLS